MRKKQKPKRAYGFLTCRKISEIGIDLVSVDRIASLLQRTSNNITTRMLSSRELHDWNKKPTALELAKFWAAKEAVFKALEASWASPDEFKKIEVKHLPKGLFSLYQDSEWNIPKTLNFFGKIFRKSHWVGAQVIVSEL